MIRGDNFSLVTVARKLPQQAPRLRVYIGSDGRPWENREPASDPTGTRSLAAELMVHDPLPSLYLGRPCYHTVASNPACETSLWTSGRYSETVISAMTGALEAIIQRHSVEQLTLVGYSGGGTIALLIAARLTGAQFDPPIEVAVITVAANLDIDAWTRYHDHLPLSGSLNPVDVVSSPAGFMQIHLVGNDDRRVPQMTIQRYLNTHPGAKFIRVDDFDHVCCWVQQWPELLDRMGSMEGFH